MNLLIRILFLSGVIVLSLNRNLSAEQTAKSEGEVLLNKDEIAQVIRHGPWPPGKKIDKSNRVSQSPLAIELGKKLFFDTRLSANNKIACSSCHDPKIGWTDGKETSGGLQRLDRNSQTLFNVGNNRWFGWDGRNDSLWAHSLGPIVEESEMGATPDKIAELVRNDQNLNHSYQGVFGVSPSEREPIEILVDLAKSLAAFQETITSDRTSFDEFRDALLQNDLEAAGRYPASAQRGAALFVGRGKCNLCHIGARFTNDEFDDAGIPYFTGLGKIDRGRFEGINRLKASLFNQLGKYNDAPKQASGWATDQVAQTHRTFGQFKVPSLRQLTQTAPYMHNGSLENLQDVVDHYSNINLDRIHSEAVPILSPLKLTAQESKDLVAFLRSLSAN